MGNQSGVIFGFLVFAFFVFITLKGELPVYAGLLLLSPSSGGGTNTGGIGQSQKAAAQGGDIISQAIALAAF